MKKYKYPTFKEPKKEIAPHVITIYERSLIEVLRPAIKNRKLIRFWYEDVENDISDWRIVEPHLIGQTKYKAAHIWLVGWFRPTPTQVYDGHLEKWGNYILDNVKQIEILDECYRYCRPLYNPYDKRMKAIIVAT